ncbi:MAG: PH domain-containing protein [Gallionella sp.]|nr:PH domain-containing protein [Gallionella sp.]
MASYIEGALIKDEKVIYKGNISLWSLSPLIFFGGLFIILGGVFMIVNGVVATIWWGLALFIWAVAYIRYKTTELAFTNKRVIAKFGFISRQTVEMNISKVESIQVNQGILGRIFNFGTLVISGAGNPQAPIPGISDPMAFRRAFMESQDSAGETKV